MTAKKNRVTVLHDINSNPKNKQQGKDNKYFDVAKGF